MVYTLPVVSELSAHAEVLRATPQDQLDGSAPCTILGVRRAPHEVLEANVRRYASAKRLPLDIVARKSGISTAQLQAIFSGEFDPDLGLVGKIAEAVGVTAADLLDEPDLN